jgi:23S rRNA (uracil1939-C5)-methyltransferase
MTVVPPLTLQIDSIDLEGQGVARHDGKVVFVQGALPGERIEARVVKRKPRFDRAELVNILRGSSQRVTPACPHFGVCGGCSMQHLETAAQLAVKQQALEDQLLHIGGVKPETVLRAVSGPAWGYRFRARLSVRYVPRKGGVLVGFHERGSSYVADMRECRVLPPAISGLLLPLRELVGMLSIRERVPQIELAVGEIRDLNAVDGTLNPAGWAIRRVIALVLRILEPLTEADRTALSRFARDHQVEWWLQPTGPDSISLFCDDLGRLAPGDSDQPVRSALAYELPEYGVRMPYRPTDFTQVNHAVNTVLVRQALGLLKPQPGERVADLFCGLGNFSLPLASLGCRVLGIEGSAVLVERATENARLNGLAAMVSFIAEDLFAMNAQRWQQLGALERLLIDPPREGALAVCQSLAELQTNRPRRIVYVSCNPATLARDAAILTHAGGWQLKSAGAVNMFPHTSHVESIAVFEPAPPPG